ncbi:MAG: hypothetical protein PHX87_06035 [Candidatus Peribacteraceae bacterium]|nr:hypothetical protein [Candidatus Peribacteraceae bacterium]MDD5742950.1 hypothetical protein [Candidatus Peribacteraceae bacterium]
MRTRLWLCAALIGCFIASLHLAIPEGHALAQVYNGPGLQQGADSLGVQGIGGGSLRGTIANIVNKVLTYVALLAVIMIIIAGLYLILSLGNDTAKETAKKIVLYVAIGLILILIAKALVMFFISLAV